MRLFKSASASLLLAVFLLTSAWAAPALIQQNENGANSVTTLTVSPTSSVTANNLLVLEVYLQGAETVTSVTDSNGTPVAAVTFQSSSAPSLGIYYEAGAASGTHTFTVTCATITNVQLYVSEWSGVTTSSPLDGTMPAVKAGSGSTATSNSVTPTVSGDLAIVAAAQSASGGSFTSWTNGFVLGQNSNAHLTGGWAYQVYNSTSSLSGGVTVGGSWSMGIALFKATPGLTPAQKAAMGFLSFQ